MERNYEYGLTIKGFEAPPTTSKKDLVVKNRDGDVVITLRDEDTPIVVFYKSGRVITFKTAAINKGFDPALIT